MRRASATAVTLLALLSLGASCNDESPQSDIRPDPSGGGERVESLSQVDIGDLTSSEQRTWRDLINDRLSPCGDPVSVGRCASEGRGCAKCVPAARYLARLVVEGYEKNEIEEMYQGRYGGEAASLELGNAPSLGAPMAPVTIVEFSDFECPYCAAAMPLLKRVVREFDGRVRLVFMHYPLTEGHPHAMQAARASVAAAKQGKFWEMHDVLFENQNALNDEDIERYAEDLGLDMERFRADLRAEDTQRLIETQKAMGREAGVRGTPTIFVNGRRFNEPPTALPAYVREELDQ